MSKGYAEEYFDADKENQQARKKPFIMKGTVRVFTSAIEDIEEKIDDAEFSLIGFRTGFVKGAKSNFKLILTTRVTIELLKGELENVKEEFALAFPKGE